MAITILKITAIPCMLISIFFMLMVLGFIPSERICAFLRKHKTMQAIIGIIFAIGIISSFIAVM